jgi:hypothetical protein
MNFRLPLVAALALLAGACSQSDSSSGAAGSATAMSASPAHTMSPAASMKAALARGYRDRFAAAPDHGALVVYPQAAVVRHDGAYTSYLASVSEAHARDAIGGVLTLPLPTGGQLRFRYERHVEHPNGDWTWIGAAVGEKGQQAIITFGDKAAFGTIGQAGEQPWRLTVQNGVSWLIRTDAAQLATINNGATRPTSPDYIVPPGQIASTTRRTASSGAMTASSTTAAAATTATASNTVDLVIGYTPGFVGYYGGDSQAQTRLNNMVDITNEAYVNSGVDARVRLVKTLQVSYADNTSNDSALEALTGFKAPSTQTSPDPAFSALRAARDQYGADLVSLVRRFQTPENDGCGIAWLIGGGQSPIDSSDEFFGYSVVSDGKDAGTDGKNYYCREETLAHELGHNMGAQHDRATAQGTDGTLSSDEYGRYPYSFGYKTTSTTGNFYTIMAYGDSGQTSYRIFSNPRSTFCGGVACGIDNQADNSRTLAQTIPIVSSFRATRVAVTQPPRKTRTSDINFDGRDDLVWRDLQETKFAYWNMSGATIVGSGTVDIGSGWRLAHVGDVNADGRADIVWQGATSLAVTFSTSNGFSSDIVNYTIPAGWTVIGGGDFDGNGYSDVLFRNSTRTQAWVWYMRGSQVDQAYLFNTGSSWDFASAVDTDGDSKADIVWVNSSQVAVSSSAGRGFDTNVVSVSRPSGWRIVGAGDIDGDGKADVVWRDSSDSRVLVWYMDRYTVRSSSTADFSASWTLGDVGDFDGDSKADLLWLSASRVAVSFSLGTSFSSDLVSQPRPQGWSLATIR